MKISKSIIKTVFSFYPIELTLRAIIHSKKVQSLFQFNINHYKFFYSLQNDIHVLDNMSCYYDYYIKNFPFFDSNYIKWHLLNYLSKFSLKNEISIDNIHPFSEEILKNIKHNIVYSIRTKDYNIKEHTNIKGVKIKISMSQESFVTLPNNIKTLYIKNWSISEQNLKQFNIYFPYLENIDFSSYSNEDEIELYKKYVPNLKKIKIYNISQNKKYDLRSLTNLSSLSLEQMDIHIYNGSLLLNEDKIKELYINYLLPINPIEFDKKKNCQPILTTYFDYYKKFPNLQTFSFHIDCNGFSKENFNLMLQKLSMIQNVKISMKLSSVTSKFLGFSLDNLTELELYGMFSFEGNRKIIDLFDIMSRNRNLIKISLFHCNAVITAENKNQNINFSNIQSLSFENAIITESAISFITKCKNLIYLKIKNFNEEVFLQLLNSLNCLPLLQTLSIKNRCNVKCGKKEIQSIVNCRFIQKVKFKIDWLTRKKEDLDLFGEAIQKLYFVHKIFIGYGRYWFEFSMLEKYLNSGKQYTIKYELARRCGNQPNRNTKKKLIK